MCVDADCVSSIFRKEYVGSLTANTGKENESRVIVRKFPGMFFDKHSGKRDDILCFILKEVYWSDNGGNLFWSRSCQCFRCFEKREEFFRNKNRHLVPRPRGHENRDEGLPLFLPPFGGKAHGFYPAQPLQYFQLSNRRFLLHCIVPQDLVHTVPKFFCR